MAQPSNAPVNVGRQTLMAVSGVAGAYQLQPTTLITQRLVGGPRQLVVTLAPIAKGQANQTPWNAPWNGTSDNPRPDPDDPNTWLPFGAPVLPDPGKGLRVKLRFGAGGASVETLFDYPAAGACFGVTADTLDLDVIAIDEGSPKVYASLDDIPRVAAWFVPGRAADPTPLQWAEAPLALGEVGVVYYSVKPFARVLDIAARMGDPLDQGCEVVWYDSEGAIVRRDYVVNTLDYPGQTTGTGIANAQLSVPSQATYCLVGTGNASGMFLLATWRIGLV